jgi:hypothetical protein
VPLSQKLEEGSTRADGFQAANDEVRYDMQLLADRIEAYWTHLHGVGTLENSLWGYDGQGMRVWLDALTIESSRVDTLRDTYETVKESVYLRLDFYPLCEYRCPIVQVKV